MSSPRRGSRRQRVQTQRYRLQPGVVTTIVTGAHCIGIHAVDPPCQTFGGWRTDRWREPPAPMSRGLIFQPPGDVQVDDQLRFEVWSRYDTQLVLRIAPMPPSRADVDSPTPI